MEQAIPVSTIASLSSDESVEMAADNPDQIINLKLSLQNNKRSPGATMESKYYKEIPETSKVDNAIMQEIINR